MLFCAALAIFFLSIFTPLWLALSTTVCVIMHSRVSLGEVLGRAWPPPLPSPCKPFLVTLNITQHEVRNDNLVSTLCLTQCDPPFRKILVMLVMYKHLQLLVQATTNGLFKFDPSTGLTTFCFFMYKPIKYYYFYFYHYNFQELDVVEK